MAKPKAKVRLPPQGKRPKGLAINRLPSVPPVNAADLRDEVHRVDADRIAWASSLLAGPSAVTALKAARLAHHLDHRIPQYGYDEELSLVLSRLGGRISAGALRATPFAKGLKWDQLNDAKLGTSVIAHVEAICEARARGTSVPAAGSRTLGLLKLGRRSAPEGAAGGGAIGDEGEEDRYDDPEDGDAGIPRRRANRRQNRAAAIVEMMCGVVGKRQAMVSDRTLVAYLKAKKDYALRAARIIVGHVPGPSLQGNQAPTWRVVSKAEVIKRNALADQEWREAVVDYIRRLWVKRRVLGSVPRRHKSGLVAYHMTLTLAGSLYDAASPDHPFTPRDAAALLRHIVSKACEDLGCAGIATVDASADGWPHLHLVLVIEVGAARLFKHRLVARYRAYGMRLQPRKGDRFNDTLVLQRVIRSVTEARWSYGTKKLAPPGRDAAAMLEWIESEGTVPSTPAEDEVQEALHGHRLAAWRQVHGIGRRFTVGIKNVRTARLLGSAQPGLHPVVTEALARSRADFRRHASLLEAVRAADRLQDKRVAGYVAGSGRVAPPPDIPPTPTKPDAMGTAPPSGDDIGSVGDVGGPPQDDASKAAHAAAGTPGVANGGNSGITIGDAGDDGHNGHNGDNGDNGHNADNGEDGHNGEDGDNADNREDGDNADNGEDGDNADNGEDGDNADADDATPSDGSAASRTLHICDAECALVSVVVPKRAWLVKATPMATPVSPSKPGGAPKNGGLAGSAPMPKRPDV